MCFQSEGNSSNDSMGRWVRFLLEAEDEITNDRFDECMVLETSDSSDESAWESASEKCDAQAHAVAGMEIVDDFSREEDRERAAEEKERATERSPSLLVPLSSPQNEGPA